MTVPDYQSLMLPVLRIAAEGETRVPAAAERVADELALTKEERDEILPSGRQRVLHNRIHWAKFYMSKAGLIESAKRGVFKASEEGQALLAKSPSTINVELLKRYPSFLDFYNSSVPSASAVKPTAADAASSVATPEEQV